MSDLNQSGLFPVGRAVLIKPYKPTREGSLIELPPEVDSREKSIEQRAVVVAFGPDAWKDETPRAKIGDHVLVSKFSGFIATGLIDKEQYRFINDKDIFAIIGTEVSTNG